MSDFQEYPDIVQEIRGALNPGRLKLQSNSVIFKNNKTGKVEQFTGIDVVTSEWLKRARGFCLKFRLKGGNVHRYDGFKDDEFEKLASFISKYYSVSLEKRDVSVKGWNWGLAKFEGNSLEFDVDNKLAFEIPLSNVSHSTTSKNEVTIEFHQNDDAVVSLTEIRFHIPNDPKDSDKDTVQEFYNQVLDKADIIQATGDAIANLTEVQCLTPRGRYDIKIYGSFLQLHGKTFDYKIPYTTVLRLFLLPHKDGRQVFFVVSLDPPIKQGQTRYHFLILLFNQEDEMTIELGLSEEELESKFEGKLQKEMSGPEFELVSRVFKAVTTRKITVPGTFKSNSGAQAISCSYKAATGFIYPLERGFIFVHKPPVHIRFDEINNVNFARSNLAGSTTRSFDFDVETKSGTVYNFANIEKGEYDKLYSFVSQKKLSVKNIDGKTKQKYAEDILASDEEDANTDHYLERMKQEGKDRFSGDEDDDSDSSDESFNPGESGSEVAEEYDSNPPTSDSSDSSDYEYDSHDDGASGEEVKGEEEGDEEAKEIKEQKRRYKEKKKKEKKSKTAKTVKEGGSRKKKKKDVDPNRPKRPMSSYMMWFNANRNDIKEKNPEAAFLEISKIGGEYWRDLSAEDKAEWDEKAKEAKAQYGEAIKEYEKNKPEAGSDEEEETKPSKSKKKKTPKKQSPKKAVDSKAGSGLNYKSKEYISSDSSSDSDEPLKKKIKKEKNKGEKKGKKEKKEKSKKKEESEAEKSSSAGELPSEEEILGTPESSHKGSESGSD